MSEFDRPRSMADMVVEQATAAPGEYRVFTSIPRDQQTIEVRLSRSYVESATAEEIGEFVKHGLRRYQSTVVDL